MTTQKFIKIGKYLWVPVYQDYLRQKLVKMEGPCCPRCHTEYLNDGLRDGSCPECNISEKFSKFVYLLKQEALLRYQAALRVGWVVESLDLPPSATKTEYHSDQKYWIEIKVGQKDGKKIAMILIGEKQGMQQKTDYAQLFLDLENEMVTFDKNNKNPIGLLAGFKAVFAGSETEINRRQLLA